MIPERLTKFMLQHGELETYESGEVFHAQNFEETLFMLKSGYVKRYQMRGDEKRVIELIYGPSHIFPLSQLYKKLFGVEQNQENLVYVYQAMTDIEIYSIADTAVIAALEDDRELYIDLFYEGGLRLKSNIERLASNAISDDYKKVAHQLVSLANEFGETEEHGSKQKSTIAVPLAAVDMAEQLNISTEVAGAVLSSLCERGLIATKNDIITILDVDALKDVYL